jgi:arylsulfatase A-like enzyme
MRRWPTPRMLGVAMLATLTVSCGRQDAPLNFVLITVDTLRADHLRTYGYFRDTSPTLDSLATRSIVFENCFSPVPTTMPAHTSILTGTHPLEHGIVENWCDVRPCFQPTPRFRSLAEALSDAGYRTGAFVSAAPLKEFSGLMAGFASYDTPQGEQRPAEETLARIRPWLEAADDRPFFLWAHFFDPHANYEPPAPFDTLYSDGEALQGWLDDHRVWHQPMNFHPGSEHFLASKAHNLYDGEIRYLDSQLARLLDWLRSDEDRWRRTILVVVGDHGEGLGQRGYAHHGGLWDDQLRVPLLLSAPGLEPRRVQEAVSVMDIAPTIAGLLGQEPLRHMAGQFHGRDLLGEGHHPEPGDEHLDRPLIGVTTNWLGQPSRTNYSLRTREWKLVTDLAGHEFVYDLTADPAERSRLALDSVPVADELRSTLGQSIERFILRGQDLRGHRDVGSAAELDEEELLEQLKALGYVN